MFITHVHRILVAVVVCFNSLVYTEDALRAIPNSFDWFRYSLWFSIISSLE